MNKYICCIHDKKADTFNTPMMFPNVTTALRSFQQACEKEETLQQWPEEFEFVLICKLSWEPGEINEKGDVIKKAKLNEPKFYNQIIAEAKEYVAINNAKNNQ